MQISAREILLMSHETRCALFCRDVKKKKKLPADEVKRVYKRMTMRFGLYAFGGPPTH